MESKVEGAKLPPFRSLSDFCFGDARFSLPHFDDPDRLSNRAVRNLLYYQTNYLALYFAVFLIIGLYFPVAVVSGALLLVGTLVVWKVVMSPVSKPNGLLSLLVLVCITTAVYYMGYIMIFVASVVMPIGVILLHAACRKRNIQNQIHWATERIGLKTTILGVLLEELNLLNFAED